MTSTPGAALRRTATVLALGGLLLAGCSSDPEQPAASGSSAGATPTAGTTAAGTPIEADTTTGAGTDAPTCPDEATLFALLPAGDAAGRSPATGAAPASCTGEWAVIGVRGPGSAQDVALFRFADGSWAAADEAAACSSDDLPAEVRASVCDAG